MTKLMHTTNYYSEFANWHCVFALTLDMPFTYNINLITSIKTPFGKRQHALRFNHIEGVSVFRLKFGQPMSSD